MRFRISEKPGSNGVMRLKLEGGICREAAAVLKEECDRYLRSHEAVELDLSDVTFVGEKGVKVLRSLEGTRVRLADCSEIVRLLLKGGN